jgi:hypothetical protein
MSTTLNLRYILGKQVEVCSMEEFVGYIVLNPEDVDSMFHRNVGIHLHGIRT